MPWQFCTVHILSTLQLVRVSVPGVGTWYSPTRPSKNDVVAWIMVNPHLTKCGVMLRFVTTYFNQLVVPPETHVVREFSGKVGDKVYGIHVCYNPEEPDGPRYAIARDSTDDLATIPPMSCVFPVHITAGGDVVDAVGAVSEAGDINAPIPPHVWAELEVTRPPGLNAFLMMRYSFMLDDDVQRFADHNVAIRYNFAGGYAMFAPIKKMDSTLDVLNRYVLYNPRGPALVRPTYEQWYTKLEESCHREDGPAETLFDEEHNIVEERCYLYGMLQDLEEKPAVINYVSGVETHYKDGMIHRSTEKGPAVVNTKNGDFQYFVNGRLGFDNGKEGVYSQWCGVTMDTSDRIRVKESHLRVPRWLTSLNASTITRDDDGCTAYIRCSAEETVHTLPHCGLLDDATIRMYVTAMGVQRYGLKNVLLADVVQSLFIAEYKSKKEKEEVAAVEQPTTTPSQNEGLEHTPPPE